MPDAADSPVNLEGILLVPQIQLSGKVGTVFRIEYATDLAQPNSWTRLKDLVLPESPFLFLDTEAAGRAKRFYRVTSGPRHPELVWLPPGTFTMGSPVEEAERSQDEGPLTHVTLTQGFWAGRYEITQFEYLSLMGSNPSAFGEDLSRPVENVSWEDAVDFCGKLTDLESAAGTLPEGYAYRLPTEAEWEYAARAGTVTRFSFGDDPDYSRLDGFCWFGGNSGDSTHPVAGKTPNPWGLSDVHGNVWEWCQDWYLVSYLGGEQVDPPGPAAAATKVIRGGSWKGLNRFCRSASRSSSLPFVKGPNVGFRLVLAPLAR